MKICFFSANFSQEDIGEPILDTELVAGDVLYFPRGTIHQVSVYLSFCGHTYTFYYWSTLISDGTNKLTLGSIIFCS